jgi:RNA polymerase sigma-70 factor (ECF subfamily)
MTDTQLLQQFDKGDINAFNTLVWRWENRVYNFIRRYVGDCEVAKDACQTTFIRVYQNVGKLNNREHFSTWLYQIAINICRDELRRRKSNRNVSLETMQEQAIASEIAQLTAGERHHPETMTANNSLRDLLDQALQRIPEKQRVIIIMKEYHGLKFTEIAEVLEISVNTAKSRMYYGLSALRKVFSKWNLTEESLKDEL